MVLAQNLLNAIYLVMHYEILSARITEAEECHLFASFCKFCYFWMLPRKCKVILVQMEYCGNSIG